ALGEDGGHHRLALVGPEYDRASEDDVVRERSGQRVRILRLDRGTESVALHRSAAYRCQSTGPARSTWAPSGRPSTSCATREASISFVRSTPVSIPISCSIEARSSVETFPVDPGGTGQPPSSPNDDSKESTPSSRAASTLARPWPRVLWKCAVSSTSPSRSRAAAKNPRTCRGFAIPVVSPKPISSQPVAA